MSLAPTNIETTVQRALAAYLRAAMPDDVSVVRSVLPSAPEANRITVLPGSAPAVAVEPFIGQVDGRSWRDETFSVRVWVECLGDDLEDVEDTADELVAQVEEVIATLPDLGEMAGVIGFGASVNRITHPMSEITAGMFYRWADIEIEVKARYD